MPSVLLVDDETPIREVVRRWLEPAGYEIGEADSADAALPILLTRAYDVILCDVQMPGHDGLWLIQQVRARLPFTAVILATTVDSVPPMISMQSGVVQYLVKPLRKEPLLAAVAAAADWHTAAVARGPRKIPAGDPIADWIKAGPIGRRAPLPSEE